MRTVFLSLHVAGGVLGLLVGLFAFQPPETRQFRRALRRLYGAAIGILAIFLVATLAVDWSSLVATQRIIFAVLVGLAGVIVIRVFLAFQLARRQPAGWEIPYVNHIFFSYISLWEGFFIVGLIDLGAPGWLVGAVAVGVLILGSILVSNYKRRIGPTTTSYRPAEVSSP
jgi:uncharacterized membrane protein YuzA (DUF378 family)